MYAATSGGALPRLLQAVFGHKTEEVRTAELRWWPRCCNSDREASLLVAPDFAATKKRQCYAYLGGGRLSIASTTLLQNIVVRVKSWDVGACVVAAAALLSRVAEDGHRVVPRADLWIAAEDVAEDEEKLDMMLGLDAAVGAAGDGAAAGAAASAPPPPLSGAAAVGAAGDDPGQSFASLCETVIGKAAIAIGLSPVANNSATDVDTLRRWAASRCPAGALQYKAPALPAPQPPRPALPAPPPRPPPAGRPASSSSWSWSEEWRSEGWWGRQPR